MSAHLIDSQIYGHLWATPEVKAMFTDEGRLRAWLDILATLAEAQADVGLVPPAAAAAIRIAVTDWVPDIEELGELTRAAGHSTLGLIRVLEQQLPDDAREWVYFGATVQDLTDTWSALVMRDVSDIPERDLVRARQAAIDLAVCHRDTIMCGRTHGQPGLPITFGFKAAVWAAEFGRHLERLAEGRPRRELVQLGGGLGSMEFWGGSARPMLESFAARLGLRAPDIPWLTARDGVAEFVSLLGMVTATVAKIGDEICQLQRAEIGEVREPRTPGTVGSITMPHKRNPELAEQVVTLARLVRVDVDLAIESMIHSHERDGRAWKTEWVLVPEACLYTAKSIAAAVSILEGLEVDAVRMQANLDSQQGYVMSEPVMRALSDHVGKHTAQRIVYEASLAGRENDLDLRSALRSDPRLSVIPDDELDRLLDPRRALGAISRYIDAVAGTSA